ncbi:GGDEF domain-containing protein [Alkalihalobacterium alkalinitrilicum]|uniref:GGDEF domain-containing protein n=1 Tax=Alkalihalobacterium alkalinitrilicum TaxID=427920 RepID=UPI001303C074|nr:GGDEF domain-containing protein [Alkalihalobacterium alkalinitrilicum]
MKTIFIILVVGHIFSVILISAYWRDHRKEQTLNYFFIAKCFQAMAWLFLALRGGIPDIFTISVANTFLFLGVSIETIALLKLQQVFNDTLRKYYIYLTFLNIVGFHLIILIHNVESLRIAFASFATAIIIIIPAYCFITKNNATLLSKFMGSLYLFVILTLIARGVAALLSNQEMGLFTPGIMQSISFLSLFLVMFLGNTGFIFLLKEKADEELVRMASFDDLTSTLNRRTFISRATQSLNRCAKVNKPVSLILFDIDYFKKINDKNGHDVGDKVLIDLSNRITRILSSNHLLGRYGGDEFAILLPETREDESTRLAEAIRLEIEEAKIEGFTLSYTLSLGVLTIVPDEQTQLDVLYVTCDKALYLAKQKGRNCVYRIPCGMSKELLVENA